MTRKREFPLKPLEALAIFNAAIRNAREAVKNLEAIQQGPGVVNTDLANALHRSKETLEIALRNVKELLDQ